MPPQFANAKSAMRVTARPSIVSGMATAPSERRLRLVSVRPHPLEAAWMLRPLRTAK